MGAHGSTLIGKAVVDDVLLPFTAWNSEDVHAAHKRLLKELDGRFGLTLEDFALILQFSDPEDARPLFVQFDTDENSLVDAFEVLGVVAMAAQMSSPDRVEFLFTIYDFNKSGCISKDEMVIMHSTLVTGCCKMDKQIEAPPTEWLEAKAELAFTMADLDSSGEISIAELQAYAANVPQAKNFLEYWDDCLARVTIPEGELWEDADFPPTGASLYKNEFKPPPGAVPPSAVEWLRPSEFMDEPTLWKGGISAGDVVQGLLGDCWFLSAMAVMAVRPHLLESLFVATGQEAQGRYCVQLYKDGDWVYIYVDDRIPCNRTGQPLYCRSSDPNEFWVMLLEKAYAKAHGSYEALIGGYCDYALRDLTGGVPEVVRLDSKKNAEKVASGEIWDDFKHYFDDGLLGASHSVRKPKPGRRVVESAHMAGILKDHAYGILELVEVGDIRLLHVRNPWGMSEWTGPWADGRPEWDAHPDLATACKYTGPVADGCFWICLEDFLEVFNTVYTCRLLPPEDGWLVQRRQAAWTEATAGGCFNFPSWVKNQQIALDLPADSEVVVCLTQPDARYHVHSGPNWNKYKTNMGFVICEFDWNAGPGSSLIPMTKVTRESIKAFTQPFRPLRDLTVSVKLSAGKYVIIPMTFRPNQTGEYWVTVYTTSLGFDLFGGKEVVWDEPSEDDVGVPDGLVIEAKAPKEARTAPVESKADIEERATQALHKMVGVLFEQVKALKEKKKELEVRVAALTG